MRGQETTRRSPACEHNIKAIFLEKKFASFRKTGNKLAHGKETTMRFLQNHQPRLCGYEQQMTISAIPDTWRCHTGQ